MRGETKHMNDLLRRYLTLASGVKTASENGTAYETFLRRNALVLVDVTAASGTNETLVVTIQGSDDNADWYDLGVVIDMETEGVLTRLTAPTTEAKIVAAGKFQTLLENVLPRYIRAKLVIAGTDPSFTLIAKAELW